MTMTHVARRGGAVLAALLLTTACLPANDSGGDDEETSESLPKGGQQLTEEEIRSVLPGEDEVPQEMGRDDEEVDEAAHDPESSSYPATCRDVELDGEEGTALDEHQTAKVTQGYTGSYGGVVNVTVASHDEVVPGELFDAAGAAQETCTEFTKTNKDASTNKVSTTKWKLTPATIKPMGERTYIANLEMLSGDEVFKGGTVQLVGVTIGHNLVYIVYSAGPKSNLSTQVVEELAQTTVDNLEAL